MNTSPSQCIAWLRSHICSASRAVETLESVLAVSNVLEIFRQCFPREFRKYERAIYPDNAVRIVDEFLGLVDRRLFPIGDQYLEEPETYDYVCKVIPVHPLMHDWYNEDAIELPVVSQVLLMLDGSLTIHDHGVRAAVLSQFPEPVQSAIVSAEGPFEFSELHKHCLAARGPLRDLSLAWEILQKDVPNNTWLQLSCEDWCEIPWEIKEVRELARQYREALALMRRFWQLEAWLRADPAKTVPQLVELWSKAKKKMRVQVAAPIAATSVRVRI